MHGERMSTGVRTLFAAAIALFATAAFGADPKYYVVKLSDKEKEAISAATYVPCTLKDGKLEPVQFDLYDPKGAVSTDLSFFSEDFATFDDVRIEITADNATGTYSLSIFDGSGEKGEALFPDVSRPGKFKKKTYLPLNFSDHVKGRFTVKPVEVDGKPRMRIVLEEKYADAVKRQQKEIHAANEAADKAYEDAKKAKVFDERVYRFEIESDADFAGTKKKLKIDFSAQYIDDPQRFDLQAFKEDLYVKSNSEMIAEFLNDADAAKRVLANGDLAIVADSDAENVRVTLRLSKKSGFTRGYLSVSGKDADAWYSKVGCKFIAKAG